MTYVSIKSSTFFEEFCKGNIDAGIEGKELVFSNEYLALETPPNLASRLWNWHINRSTTENARRINELAQSKLKQILVPSIQDKERIITTCRAASRTCLMIAKLVENESQELAESLEEHGREFLNREVELSGLNPVRVACQNATFKTALQLIINRKGTLEDAEGHYDILAQLAYSEKQYALYRELVAKGAAPGDTIEASILFDAIHDGQEEVAKKLVECGCSLDKKQGGKFPLHVAAAKGFTSLVELMIAHRAEVSATDWMENTALHEAAKGFHADVAKALLRHNVDVSKINKELDPDTKDICQGAPALFLPAKNRMRAVPFYTSLLASYNIPEAILSADGIEVFLEECRKKPENLIHRQENPFELALLFQHRALAEAVVSKMSLKEFFEHMKRLKQQFPTSNLATIEFCYLSINNRHLGQEVAELRVEEPACEVSLDELLTFTGSENSKWHLKAFIARIIGKSQMTGLFSGDEELARFYDLLTRCLKNCIIDAREMPEKKAFIVETLVELEKQEQHTAGSYFAVITKLFRTIKKERVVEFEKKIQIALAEHREELLQRCLDPARTNSHNEYNYVLARCGKEFGLPGLDTSEHYKTTLGQCDLDAVRTRFWQIYTPESIINGCILPLLDKDPVLNREFCNWLIAKMPKEWGSAIAHHFNELKERAETKEEELLEFLHKNGVAVREGQSHEEAIEETRRSEYLKREVFFEGKIMPHAIARMLAGLEAEVLSSARLEHESSPTTFASKWMKKILDLV